MDLDLTGKVALVTGASQGLGAAIARTLAAEGMRLCLAARNRAKLDAVAAELGADTVVIEADLSRPEGVAETLAAVRDRAGTLDLLVNNAGATKREDFFTLSEQDWQDGFDLKFHGYVRATRAAWPLLRASGGSVVNIVGIGARGGKGEFTIGGSVNAALLNFTKAMSEYGIRDGVRVNAINPGRIETDRLARHLDRYGSEHGLSAEAAAGQMLRELGIARFGRADEIGDLVAFLASRRAGFMQGAIVDIDGGEVRAL